MEIRPGITLANLSDVGLVRENNEDYFCYVEPEGEEEFAKRGRLAIIADGMGGYEGGQIASHMAVDIFARPICKSWPRPARTKCSRAWAPRARPR
jgi:serine/threonine protein phosphatase PrpC